MEPERIVMSQRERDRLRVLREVEQDYSLRREAAQRERLALVFPDFVDRTDIAIVERGSGMRSTGATLHPAFLATIVFERPFQGRGQPAKIRSDNRVHCASAHEG
jgi:hypothetical protein